MRTRTQRKQPTPSGRAAILKVKQRTGGINTNKVMVPDKKMKIPNQNWENPFSKEGLADKKMKIPRQLGKSTSSCLQLVLLRLFNPAGLVPHKKMRIPRTLSPSIAVVRPFPPTSVAPPVQSSRPCASQENENPQDVVSIHCYSQTILSNQCFSTCSIHLA